MNPEISSLVTHGNLELEKALREIVGAFLPPFIPGNIYVVFNSTDQAYVQYYKDHNKRYNDGTEVVHTSLSAAYSAVTSNRNDVVLLNGQGTHSLSAMLSVAKNRVHFYGMGSQLRYGQPAKVSLGVTTAATDIGTLQNTGVRNSFHNIKVLNSNTVAEGIYSVVEAGEYALYENVEMYKSTDLDQVGAAELVLNGDSAQFKKCTIGSLVDERTANGARPNVLLTREIVSGKVCRDVIFEDSLFWYKAGDTDNRFIYGAGATDVERMLLFKDCTFINTKLASQTMTLGAHVAAALTQGYMLFKNCSNIGTTDWATQTGIFVDNGAAAAANGGEMIQAA